MRGPLLLLSLAATAAAGAALTPLPPPLARPLYETAASPSPPVGRRLGNSYSMETGTCPYAWQTAWTKSASAMGLSGVAVEIDEDALDATTG